MDLTEEIVGTNYKKFGVLLLEDNTGELLRAFERELGRNAGEINIRVFNTWLSGKGRKPVSWDTLVTVLQDIKLNKLAKDIKKTKLPLCSNNFYV